jgi:hypothetical protein
MVVLYRGMGLCGIWGKGNGELRLEVGVYNIEMCVHRLDGCTNSIVPNVAPVNSHLPSIVVGLTMPLQCSPVPSRKLPFEIHHIRVFFSCRLL